MSWRDASADENVSCELCVVIEDCDGSLLTTHCSLFSEEDT